MYPSPTTMSTRCTPGARAPEAAHHAGFSGDMGARFKILKFCSCQKIPYLIEELILLGTTLAPFEY